LENEQKENDGHWLDFAWKDVLSLCIEDAIEFFLPGLARKRDFSRKIEKIGDSFPRIGAESDKGMRISDLAFSVPVIDGTIRKLGLFTESQHRDDESFEARMFQTFYRMMDNLKEQITALAIFTGDAKDRNEYRYTDYDNLLLLFRYNTYHILSQTIENLRRDERKFAPVILAARMMLEAKGVPGKRENYALELLKILRERGYDIERKRNIIKFVRRILRLAKNDINPEIRRKFVVTTIPMDEVKREIYIRDAKEERSFEIAKSLLDDGISAEVVSKNTGLDLEDVLGLIDL
jgi:hypothetical protein